jgi:hypothetical protein
VLTVGFPAGEHVQSGAYDVFSFVYSMLWELVLIWNQKGELEVGYQEKALGEKENSGRRYYSN